MANNPDVAVQKLNIEFSRDSVTRSFGIFDPLATASFSSTRTQTPSNSLLQGAETLNTLSQPFALGFQQLLETGTQYNINFSDFKSSTNSSFSTFNPQLTSTHQFQPDAAPATRPRDLHHQAAGLHRAQPPARRRLCVSGPAHPVADYGRKLLLGCGCRA